MSEFFNWETLLSFSMVGVSIYIYIRFDEWLEKILNLYSRIPNLLKNFLVNSFFILGLIIFFLWLYSLDSVPSPEIYEVYEDELKDYYHNQ